MNFRDFFTKDNNEINSYKEEIEEDILNNITCINSLRLLKEKEDICRGEVYRTLGFYKKDDRGAATYYITEKNDLEIDNMFVIELKNDLVGVLSYGTKVEAETLGFRDSYRENYIFNNSDLLNNFFKYVSKKKLALTLKFGSGWYGFSETTLYYNWGSGLSIEGMMAMGTMYPSKTNDSNIMFGTMFFPIEKEQNHILKITAPKEEFNLPMGVNIKDICFFGGLPSIQSGVFTTNANTKGTKIMLDLERATFGNFTNLQFVGGTAVTRALSWCGYECQFDNLMFRDLGSFETLESAFYCYLSTENDDYAVPSGGFATRLGFENIPGPWIKNDGSVEYQFNIISGETSTFDRIGYKSELIEDLEEIKGAREIPLFEINNSFGALQFNNITSQHNGRFIYSNGKDRVIFNTIFKNKDSEGRNKQLHVSNVTLQGNRSNIKMLDFLESKEINYRDIPVYSFRNIILSNTIDESVDVFYNVPRYVLLDRDKPIYNSKLKNEVIIDWFGRFLDFKDNSYISRTVWDSQYQCNKMLCYPSDKSEFFEEPYLIFKCKTNNIIGNLLAKVNILAKKTGDEIRNLIIVVKYEDDTDSAKIIEIDSDIPKNYLTTLNIENKVIKEIILQQQYTIEEDKQIEVFKFKFDM